MITEDYVSFETAKLLKEKGFDEPCKNRYYETHSGFDLGLDPGYTNSHWEDWYKDMGVRNYSAPTLQMTMKWLREVHSLHIDVIVTYQHIPRKYEAHIMKLENVDDFILHQNVDFASYEQACETAIKYCLENLI